MNKALHAGADTAGARVEPPASRRALAGLLVRREAWRLTWRGWAAGGALTLGLLIVCGRSVYPFLAVTARVPARLLVIEGWAQPVTMRQAAKEFRDGDFERAVLIRPVLDVADQYESGRYSGDWVSALLVRDGLPKDKLTTLFPEVARKDRTYHSALVVKDWIAKEGLAVDALDLATQECHARRSRLLYEKAFGDQCKIGIISMPTHEYDPRHWWRTSEGVRDVIGETIAYVYARCFFRRSNAD